jgi:hypothetical protein
MSNIRTLFSPRRQIDRNIEKVIDYYAQEEKRLAQEIEEYEITDNIERCFRKFLDAFGEGVRVGNVTEIGIWVAGFYGSGKSSFTKYLGAALDPNKEINGRPFLDLLCERFPKNEIPGQLRTIAKKYPTAVVMLDLGAEQLSENASATVSTVLYWKILQWAGFSKEKKIARLEFTLDRRGIYEEFKTKYRERYNAEWDEIQNDPLIGVARAAEIVPLVLPNDFPTPESFRNLRFEDARNLRDLAQEIIDICIKTARKDNPDIENVIFFIDEAGQYVAPRSELILNLDGLARNLKELGRGRVWIAATGQQTLNEIVEKAAYNSAELNKLRDRFPIAIDLDASDIREITHRRLLEKSEEGRTILLDLYGQYGQALVSHTRLCGTKLFKGDPDAEIFAKLYPFLPQHFDLLLELIRTLARSTGGIGLRSAIRVIQDVLVDKNRILGLGATTLADREIGTLACVDDFYDSLRADIAKVLPHVVSGVDRSAKIFADRPVIVRVAKAVAALQPIETFPRNAENIAALLYPVLGSQSLVDEVKDALRALTKEEECGLKEDPQSGGYLFLSDAVKPLQKKRNEYIPTSSDFTRTKILILKEGSSDHQLFRIQPSSKLEGSKEVKAAVKLNRNPVIAGNEDIEFRLEFIDSGIWDEKKKELLVSTAGQPELKNSIVLLAKNDDALMDLLSEAIKSSEIVKDTDEGTVDRDVSQFLRAERRTEESSKDLAAAALDRALLDGLFVFRGKPTPVREAGNTLEAAIRNILGIAARDVYKYYHLAPIRPSTDAAAKFLSVERLDRVPAELDLLKLLVKDHGTARINMAHPALTEVLHVFQSKIVDFGGRLQGNYLQELFSSPPYGWTKDTVRYLFAILLRASEVELYVPGADGPVRTPGFRAIEAVKSTVAFNRVGVSSRDIKPSIEVLDRAAQRMESLFGDEVLPLEENISRAVSRHVPGLIENIGALPDRLRLLGLSGEDRARQVLGDAADLLKGDAGGAAAILGGKECQFLEEIIWARSVFNALESGAEADVIKARSILASLDQLESAFPDISRSLLSETDLETAQDILLSNRFHERIPELRSIIRSLSDKTSAQYLSEKKELDAAVKNGRNSLESMPEWSRVEDEDRGEIASRFSRDLPETADESNPVRSLHDLIVFRRTLSGLLDELRTKIKNMVPRQLQPEPPIEPVETSEKEKYDEYLTPEALLGTQQRVIKTKEDLESLIKSLRERLEPLIKDNKSILIRGSQ